MNSECSNTICKKSPIKNIIGVVLELTESDRLIPSLWSFYRPREVLIIVQAYLAMRKNLSWKNPLKVPEMGWSCKPNLWDLGSNIPLWGAHGWLKLFFFSLRSLSTGQREGWPPARQHQRTSWICWRGHTVQLLPTFRVLTLILVYDNLKVITCIF
jgi:hypothetical protein